MPGAPRHPGHHPGFGGDGGGHGGDRDDRDSRGHRTHRGHRAQRGGRRRSGGPEGGPGGWADVAVTRRRLLAGALGLGAVSAGALAAERMLSGSAAPAAPPALPTPAPRSSAPVGGVTAPPSVEPGVVKKAPENLLSIFGAPGTFGELDADSTVATVEVPGWGFGPGHAAFLSTVAGDGTVFISTTPFTDDQSKLTGANMEIGVFQPERRRFTRLIIPSSTGRLSQPRADPAFHGIGGGDVSDVIVVPDPDGGERVVFTSLMPYYYWDLATYGQLPSIGQLRPGPDGTWQYHPELSRTADALAATVEPHVAATAFPIMYPGSPRSPRGPASIARLPRSGHLVIAQYLGTGYGGTENGALLVVDLDGRVRAYWQYPQVWPLGTPVVVNPREVVADPTSEPDDERFVLISDCRGADYITHPFPIQEFSYNASTGQIIPKSTAVRAVQDGSRMETACFGPDGTLYVARTKWDGLRADTLAVYPKLGRERGLVTRTPAQGNWPSESWGTQNQPDFFVPGTDRGGLVRSITVDPKTGAVLLAGLDGLVTAVRPAGSGSRMTFRTDNPIDVGLNRLRGPSTRYVGVRRGAVDAERRVLWLPVNQMVLDGIPWPYPPFKLDQWLLRVDLRILLGE